MSQIENTQQSSRPPTLIESLIPIVWVFVIVIGSLVIWNADHVQEAVKYAMLSAALLTLAIARLRSKTRWIDLGNGVKKAFKQLFPALVVMAFTGMISTVWMLSGVVPTLIEYGLRLLDPKLFLLIACAFCSVVSLFTGSSWTTVATIGIALQGIGTVFGFSNVWIAGAIISGAYFGDKLSPLSDTTVLASSVSGVPLIDHIKYMLYSTVPTISIALLVYLIAGLCFNAEGTSQISEMSLALDNTFNVTAWTLIIPLITGILISRRFNIYITLACSTVLGIIGLIVFQPDVLQMMQTQYGAGNGIMGKIWAIICSLWAGAEFETGYALLNELTDTNGILGMAGTFVLILCAMIFSGFLMGAGMLNTITDAFNRHVHGVRKTVGVTVGSGLTLNMAMGDHYTTIILMGNMYSDLYKRQGLEPRLLSRTIEDSATVTSVLIPWSTCGMFLSTVLGISTFTYLPYCVFNYLSPVMSMVLAYTGFSIKKPGGAAKNNQ